MKQWCTAIATVGLMLATAGCHKDYGRVRPPSDELSDDGRGLQGKDVIDASDKMAASLLALPALNGSQHQWVIVVDHVENLSGDQRKNLDSFLIRTKVQLSKLGGGRIQLVENRDKLRYLQAHELDVNPDNFGQGGINNTAGGRLQPDFSMTATLSDLPNRETNYFLVNFSIVNLHDGTQPWQDLYEVTTNR